MAPVRGLLVLISEIAKIYGSQPSATRHAIITECCRLRAWSMTIESKQQLCVRDAELLDARLTYLTSVLVGDWLAIMFDDSVDAIFAKGSNIIVTLHLRDLREKFEDFSIQLRHFGNDTDDGMDELLTRIHSIEHELGSSADAVLEYPALISLNHMVGLKLAALLDEIVNVCKNHPEFHALHVDLTGIQQRLALDQ
jgi:hypothetical protein